VTDSERAHGRAEAPHGDDDPTALAVIATGLLATAAPTLVQVLWLLGTAPTLLLLPRCAHPDRDDRDDGGGGGGGVPTAPPPPQTSPSGTK